MSTVFCTHCSDDWFYNGGCNKLLATAKYYNKDVPFFVFTSLELNKLNEKYNGQLNWDILNPIISMELKSQFDKVIHIDADSLILGPLEEIFESTADILTVRNNNDYNTASKFTDLPVTINGCIPENYMNAGLVGTSNVGFLSHWIYRNFNEAQNYPYREQDILNLILQEGKFTSQCLDPKDKDVHYGISCHYGKDTYWDSSKDIVFSSGEFLLGKKKIKVYHQAGGHHHFPKLNLEVLFNSDTKKEIERIINSQKVKYEKIII